MPSWIIVKIRDILLVCLFCFAFFTSSTVRRYAKGAKTIEWKECRIHLQCTAFGINYFIICRGFLSLRRMDGWCRANGEAKKDYCIVNIYAMTMSACALSLAFNFIFACEMLGIAMAGICRASNGVRGERRQWCSEAHRNGSKVIKFAIQWMHSEHSSPKNGARSLCVAGIFVTSRCSLCPRCSPTPSIYINFRTLKIYCITLQASNFDGCMCRHHT